MTKESGAYISKIRELGLNDISRRQLNHVAEVFGPKFLNIATEDEKQKAREYLKGPKMEFETKVANVAWKLGGRIISEWLAEAVKKMEPGTGLYILNVGFNGNEPIDIIKIQTLKNGADKIENDIFEGSSFSPEDKYVRGKRIGGNFVRLLRSGFDEIPQLQSVAKKEMFLIGIRGYTPIERESNEMLYELTHSPELNNSKLVKWVLTKHQQVIKDSIRPGIANPMSCLQADLTTHILRMYLDIMYIEKASRELDITILVKSLTRRFKRAARIIKHIV